MKRLIKSSDYIFPIEPSFNMNNNMNNNNNKNYDDKKNIDKDKDKKDFKSYLDEAIDKLKV